MTQVYEGVTVTKLDGQLIYRNGSANITGHQATIECGGFTPGSSFESNGTYQLIDGDGNLLGTCTFGFPLIFQFAFSPSGPFTGARNAPALPI